MTSRDTIAAIATAPGRAGIGIVRVSGSRLLPLAEQLTRRTVPARQPILGGFYDRAGNAIDQGIALYFPAPKSYTGEDVLELQGHGGPVVLKMVLRRCLELGARVAEPGEFTQRAFRNGKLDLAQAEAVIDLIDATTSAAARGAMRSLSGEFSSQIQTLNTSIIELRARVEAALDFPDEEIDFIERAGAEARLNIVRERIRSVLDAARLGSLLREGMHVVLAGQPNVGKSSLLNRLVGEELAIVTDLPGTTRDPIRQAIDLEGIPLHIVDTAGLRDSVDPVERIGVERAWRAIERADAVVMLVDAREGMSEVDREILAKLPSRLPRVRVMNKIDLAGQEAKCERLDDETVVWLSAKTGTGMDLLRQALLDLAGWRGESETVFLARERHLEALSSAKAHIEAAAGQRRHWELFAEELRLAQEQLSRITGEFTADDLLGEIFSRFCIGK